MMVTPIDSIFYVPDEDEFDTLSIETIIWSYLNIESSLRCVSGLVKYDNDCWPLVKPPREPAS